MNRLTSENYPGLTKEGLKSLRGAGINSVLDFIAEDVQSLSANTNLSLEELSVMRRRMLVENSALAFRGIQLYDEMINSLEIIQTGCPNFDQLLGGGLYCKEVTELYGLPAIGKTQSCLSIASHAALELGRNTIYIDTGGTFSSKRIEEILQKKCEGHNKMDYGKSMARIHCVKAFDIFSTLASLEGIKSNLSNCNEGFFQDVALVIVDSVASVISPILGSTGYDGHALMISLGRMLKSLAMDYNLAVLVINNVVSDFPSNLYTKPALGKTWSHIPNNRIYLYQDHHQPKFQRLIKLTKSCRMPLEAVLTVAITEKGLTS